jgi:hypothetical protein
MDSRMRGNDSNSGDKAVGAAPPQLVGRKIFPVSDVSIQQTKS